MAEEGLALAIVNDWQYENIHTTAARLLRENKLPTILSMVENWNDHSAYTSYPAAGSFIDYLINFYGINSVKCLYRKAITNNFAEIIQTIYGKSLETLENEWHQFLGG